MVIIKCVNIHTRRGNEVLVEVNEVAKEMQTKVENCAWAPLMIS
jgi:hypothetical protein